MSDHEDHKMPVLAGCEAETMEGVELTGGVAAARFAVPAVATLPQFNQGLLAEADLLRSDAATATWGQLERLGGQRRRGANALQCTPWRGKKGAAAEGNGPAFFDQEESEPVFTNTDALASTRPGHVLVQKDFVYTNTRRHEVSTVKRFQTCKLSYLMLRKAAPRATRAREDDASLYWSIEHGMTVKFYMDWDGGHLVDVKGNKESEAKGREAFRELATTILNKTRSALSSCSLPDAVFAVNMCEGWKPSAHVTVLTGAFADDVDCWKAFFHERVAPQLSEEEALVVDSSVYRVGAFRMNGMCKKLPASTADKPRYLSDEPDPMLSDGAACARFQADRLQYELLSCPLYVDDKDACRLNQHFTHAASAPNASHRRLSQRTAKSLSQLLHGGGPRGTDVTNTMDSEALFVRVALAYVRQRGHDVRSIKKLESTYYVGVGKNEVDRTCVLTGRCHGSNNVGYIVDCEDRLLIAHCFKPGCTASDGTRCVRLLHRAGTNFVEVPAAPAWAERVLAWLLNKTHGEAGANTSLEHAKALSEALLSEGFVRFSGLWVADAASGRADPARFEYRSSGSLFLLAKTQQGGEVAETKVGDYHVENAVLPPPDFAELSPKLSVESYAMAHMLPYKLPEGRDTLCVRADYGMGKTTLAKTQLCASAIGPFVSRERVLFPDCVLQGNEAKTMMVITHRRTVAAKLLGDLAPLLPDVILYTDIDNGTNPTPNKVVMQLDSIGKAVHLLQGVDVLLLDEVESTLMHFESDTMAKRGRGALVYAHFELTVKNAKRVVALDADLGVRTVEFLGRVRGYERIHVVNNLHQNHVNHVVRIVDDFGRWMSLIRECLRAGRRPCIVLLSRNKARTVLELLQREFPDKVGKLYDSDCAEADKLVGLQDVKGVWSRLDYLIYTPTIESGVSFDVPDHFDAQYAYACGGSCSPRALLQMLHRVRAPRQRVVYMHLDSSIRAAKSAPTMTMDELHELVTLPAFLAAHGITSLFHPSEFALDGNGNVSWIYPHADQPYLKLHLRNIQEIVHAKHHFAYVLWALLRERGYGFEYDRGGDGAANRKALAETKEASAALKDAEVAAIVAARDLSGAEYYELCERVDDSVSEEERAQQRRYRLRKGLHHADGLIDDEFVRTYSGLVSQFKHLCAVAPTRTQTEAQQRRGLMDVAEEFASRDKDAPYSAVRDCARRNAWRHQTAADVLQSMGFDGVFDKTTRTRAEMASRIGAKEEEDEAEGEGTGKGTDEGTGKGTGKGTDEGADEGVAATGNGTATLVEFLQQKPAQQHAQHATVQAFAASLFEKKLQSKPVVEWGFAACLKWANGMLKSQYGVRVVNRNRGRGKKNAAKNARYGIEGLALWRSDGDGLIAGSTGDADADARALAQHCCTLASALHEVNQLHASDKQDGVGWSRNDAGRGAELAVQLTLWMRWQEVMPPVPSLRSLLAAQRLAHKYRKQHDLDVPSAENVESARAAIRARYTPRIVSAHYEPRGEPDFHVSKRKR